MRKTILILGLVLVLVLSVFALTGCNKSGEGESDKSGKSTGRKTTELSYTAPSIYKLKVSVPVEKDESGEEKPVYEFTEESPEGVKDLFYGEGQYLAGDKVVMTFETTSYTYHTGVSYKEAHGDVTPSFEGFKEFVLDENSTSTLKGSEVTKVGDREVLKAEYRQGTGKGELYGYRYIINIDDIYPRGYFTLSVVTADGNPESVESVFADEEVIALINSVVIEGQE